MSEPTNNPSPTIGIEAGIYRHYKGNLYQVYDVAIHSESLDKLVVYRPLYGERRLWVRPLSMFHELVEIDGVYVKRFEWAEAHNDGQDLSPGTPTFD